MPSFDSDGVAIDYLDEGEGPLVVLVHGFASNRVVNWVNTGCMFAGAAFTKLLRMSKADIALAGGLEGCKSSFQKPKGKIPGTPIGVGGLTQPLRYHARIL